MIISSGALNGSAVNALALNAGVFALTGVQRAPLRRTVGLPSQGRLYALPAVQRSVIMPRPREALSVPRDRETS